MAVPGFYRRVLPSPPAIDFSSPQGKKLFVEANNDGTMEGFFKLIPCFQTQAEPAYCGLATLAMVLNALAIDPCRKWKGPWRWFDESMLDCCEPLENIRDKGISFGKVVCLAHCAGANVQAFRTNQSSVDEFRKCVIACSRSGDCHVISSYNRRAFQQTGSGHFSPLGGYHAESDMVLILDVARFKYPPHWVPISLLWEAMDTIDPATGQHRGFMLVSKRQRPPAFVHNLSCKHEGWISTAKYLVDDVPVLLSSDNVKDIKDVISTVFSSLPSDFSEFIKWVAEVRTKEDGAKVLSQEEKETLSTKAEVLKLVQDTGLYKQVTETLSSAHFLCMRERSLGHRDCLPTIATRAGCQGAGKCNLTSNCEELSSCSFESCGNSGMPPANNDVLTALLLALPPQTWSAIKDEQVFNETVRLVSVESLPLLLQEEVLHLREQLLLLKRCQENKVEDDLDAPLL